MRSGMSSIADGLAEDPRVNAIRREAEEVRVGADGIRPLVKGFAQAHQEERVQGVVVRQYDEQGRPHPLEERAHVPVVAKDLRVDARAESRVFQERSARRRRAPLRPRVRWRSPQGSPGMSGLVPMRACGG